MDLYFSAFGLRAAIRYFGLSPLLRRVISPAVTLMAGGIGDQAFNTSILPAPFSHRRQASEAE